LEDDGTVLLRTINSQFATAIGLRYKGPSGAWRAIKNGEDGVLLPPKGGWGDNIYCLAFSEVEEPNRKRKATSDVSSVDHAKSANTSTKYLLRDLAVMGIPYDAKLDELRTYFNDKYGGVSHFIINHDRATGKPKGFGFIRFDNEESARNALEGEDHYLGRQIFIKKKTVTPIKMYVKDLPEDTTQDELVEYFSNYGEIIDSYVPKPFRRYAFFTYGSYHDGIDCLKDKHVFKGEDVKVSKRLENGMNPKDGSQGGRDGGRFGGRDDSNYSRDRSFPSRDGGFAGRDGGYSSRDGGFAGRDGGYGSRNSGYSARDGNHSGRDVDRGSRSDGHSGGGSMMNEQMKNEFKNMIREVLTG